MPALTFATPTTAASQGSRLVEASVGRHSEKPSVFCENFPTLPKIELHARGVVSRPGWDVWGLEAPASAEIRHAERAARRESALDLMALQDPNGLRDCNPAACVGRGA
jgi:hypothetical protein